MTHNISQFPDWNIKSQMNPEISPESHECSRNLKNLFVQKKFNGCLDGLVDFGNQYDLTGIDFLLLFGGWNNHELQSALDFFYQPKFIELVNAVFFYKLHPDKLFNNLLHSEKLVSIRIRLKIFHHYIILMHKQLSDAALRNGLIPGVDYFLQDEELPQGILIEANEEFRQIIQVSIRRLKINSRLVHTKQEHFDSLYELRGAYKFWFNPDRLIDAVMMLQLNIMAKAPEQECQFTFFQKKMLDLYNQIATTECLDLYGYFSNNDSRYLLATFFTIKQGGSFEWLPVLNDEEKTAVIAVFDALHCVMEALRVALKNRHIISNAYSFDLLKPDVRIGHRNRNAVFRAITVYKQTPIVVNYTMAELFRYMEEEHK